MRGVVTLRHVLAHPALVIRCYGCSVFLRCVVAAFARKPTTFLEVIFS